jgi:uncharacterized membrane protein
VAARQGRFDGLARAIAQIMSPKRPVHPILMVLPLAAFAVTFGALVAHAVTDDAEWYRRALFADLGGLALAVVGTLAAAVDATGLPSFTVARTASFRHGVLSILGFILFAGAAMMIFHRYEDRAVGDVAPLALAAVGLTAFGIAGWYGRVVSHAIEVRYTTVRYPARMLLRPSTRQRPGSAMTIH